MWLAAPNLNRQILLELPPSLDPLGSSGRRRSPRAGCGRLLLAALWNPGEGFEHRDPQCRHCWRETSGGQDAGCLPGMGLAFSLQFTPGALFAPGALWCQASGDPFVGAGSRSVPPPTGGHQGLGWRPLTFFWECVLAVIPSLACVFQALGPPKRCPNAAGDSGHRPWLRISDKAQTPGPPLLSGGSGLPTARQLLRSPRWVNAVDLGIGTADGVKRSCLGSSAVKSRGGGLWAALLPPASLPSRKPLTPRGHVHCTEPSPVREAWALSSGCAPGVC